MTSTSTTGTVTDIKVNIAGTADIAFVTLLESTTGQTEQFIIWVGDIGQPTPFSVWIARSLVLSMLKDALVNKLTVVLSHGNSSSIILWVDLLAA
jgi:hypothetical protein